MANSERTLLGNVLWTPWSVVCWLANLCWMGLLAIVALPITVFVPFERFQHIHFHKKVVWPIWVMFSRLRATHDPKYQRERVSAYMFNHVSMFDANIVCGALDVPICGLENAAHLNIPGYGWLLRTSNSIPVRKGAGASRFRAITEAFRERASRGISVVSFPEGHRTLDGKVAKFKSGAFRAARDAGLPIVPVATRGSYRLLPKGSFTIRPSLVDIYVAPQIETKGLTDAQLPLLIERVHEVIEAWVERGEMLGHRCLEPLGDPPSTKETEVVSVVPVEESLAEERTATA